MRISSLPKGRAARRIEVDVHGKWPADFGMVDRCRNGRSVKLGDMEICSMGGDGLERPEAAAMLIVMNARLEDGIAAFGRLILAMIDDLAEHGMCPLLKRNRGDGGEDRQDELHGLLF